MKPEMEQELAMSEEADEYWVSMDRMGANSVGIHTIEPTDKVDRWGRDFFTVKPMNNHIGTFHVSKLSGDIPEEGMKFRVETPVFRNGKIHLQRKETP